jgi:hypothetical protein
MVKSTNTGGLLGDEMVMVSVQESGNSKLRDRLMSYLRGESTYHTHCECKASLRKDSYILCNLDFLVWTESPLGQCLGLF